MRENGVQGTAFTSYVLCKFQREASEVCISNNLQYLRERFGSRDEALKAVEGRWEEGEVVEGIVCDAVTECFARAVES